VIKGKCDDGIFFFPSGKAKTARLFRSKTLSIRREKNPTVMLC
jgi:hypothetical protein